MDEGLEDYACFLTFNRTILECKRRNGTNILVEEQKPLIELY